MLPSTQKFLVDPHLKIYISCNQPLLFLPSKNIIKTCHAFNNWSLASTQFAFGVWTHQILINFILYTFTQNLLCKAIEWIQCCLLFELIIFPCKLVLNAALLERSSILKYNRKVLCNHIWSVLFHNCIV